jgi:hypothetical protein
MKPEPKLPPLSTGWRVWFAVCGVVGVGILALFVWLVVAAIAWLGRH